MIIVFILSISVYQKIDYSGLSIGEIKRDEKMPVNKAFREIGTNIVNMK